VQHVAPASTETTNLTKFGVFGSSHIFSPIGEIWHGKVNLWCALLCHISPGRVHHATPAWLGTSNLTSFGIFEASDTNFRYQWGKFGMLQWTCDMLYMPNFILICALINASYHPCHVRNCKFDWLLNSGGLIITPSLIRVDLWEWTCSMLLHTEFYLDWCIMSPLRGEKLQIWPHFQIQYSVMMPSSGAEAEINVHAQLQTFSCLMT